MPIDDFEPAAKDRSATAAQPGRRPLVRHAGSLSGVDLGAIAVAATGGAIAGLGLRRGSVLEPFAAAGRLLLGVAPTELGAARQMALAAGVLAHIGCVMLWSILFVRLAGRARGGRLLVFALAFAAVASLVDRRILPVSLRLGHAVSGTVMQTVFLYMVLSLALLVGMRLAFLPVRDGSRSRAISHHDVIDA